MREIKFRAWGIKDSQKDWHHSIENLGNEVKIIGNVYE